MRNVLALMLSLMIFSNAYACGAASPSTMRLTVENHGQETRLSAGDHIEVTLPGAIGDRWRVSVKPSHLVKLEKIVNGNQGDLARTIFHFNVHRSTHDPFSISIKGGDRFRAFTHQFNVKPTTLSVSGCGGSPIRFPDKLPEPEDLKGLHHGQ